MRCESVALSRGLIVSKHRAGVSNVVTFLGTLALATFLCCGSVQAQEYTPKVRNVGGVTQTIFPPSRSTVDVFRPPEAIYQFVDTNGNLTAVPNPITTNTPAEVTNIIRAAIQPSTLARVEALKPSDLFAVDVNIGPNAYVLRSTTISNLIATVNPTVINVRMFGAVGDGKADDSAAIRAAWNAWTNLPCGGVLYFPSGVYKDANPGYTLSYLQ